MESETSRTLPSVRVAVIDDDSRLRQHLVRILNTSSQLECAWSAGSLKEARKHLPNLPDVALVDLGLPDGSGAELIEDLQGQGATKVLIVSVFDDKQTVLNCIQSGADGYIVKESTPAEIVRAVEALMDGGSPISATAAIHLMDLVRQPGDKAANLDHVEVNPLTPRETELLQLFVKGITYKEAADMLDISRHTVGDHMKSIFRKLAVKTRSEAVYEAVSKKFIHL